MPLPGTHRIILDGAIGFVKVEKGGGCVSATFQWLFKSPLFFLLLSLSVSLHPPVQPCSEVLAPLSLSSPVLLCNFDVLRVTAPSLGDLEGLCLSIHCVNS